MFVIPGFLHWCSWIEIICIVKNAEVTCFDFQSIIYVSVLISVIKSLVYINNKSLYTNNNNRLNY